MLDACTAWLAHVHLYISLDTLPPYPLPTLHSLSVYHILPPFPSPLSPPTLHHSPSFLPSPYPTPLPSPSPLLPSLYSSSLALPPPFPFPSPAFPSPTPSTSTSSLPSPFYLPFPLLPSPPPSSFLSTLFPSPPPSSLFPFLSQVKRLKLSMQHRETQFIHDTRKKEREYNRLKERLGQVMMME